MIARLTSQRSLRRFKLPGLEELVKGVDLVGIKP